MPKYLDVNQKMEKSCMCENSLDENILIPSQCFTINVTRGNRICIDWWFNKFAMENKSHKCPGCDKKRNRKTWIILCNHINYGSYIEEPRKDWKK